MYFVHLCISVHVHFMVSTDVNEHKTCGEFSNGTVVMVMCMAYHTYCTVADCENEKCSSRGSQFYLHLLCVGRYVHTHVHPLKLHTVSAHITRVNIHTYFWFKNIG